METISVNQFRDNLKSFVDKASNRHEPLKVTRRAANDFVVLSAEDWEREQETLYILQNIPLMQQLTQSISTHAKQNGETPSQEQLDEILSI